MSKYRVNDTTPSVDGSGSVIYDISALDASGQPMPHMRAFIRVPAADVAAAEALPTAAAKNLAHKALLVANCPDGWTAADLDDDVTNNLAAKEASDLVNARLSFPLTFSL